MLFPLLTDPRTKLENIDDDEINIQGYNKPLTLIIENPKIGNKLDIMKGREFYRADQETKNIIKTKEMAPMKLLEQEIESDEKAVELNIFRAAQTIYGQG